MFGVFLVKPARLVDGDWRQLLIGEGSLMPFAPLIRFGCTF
jgi:hypothetical protein